MSTTIRRKRDPAAARAGILDAAKQLLADGDGTLEMNWVARAAGVSQGLAYHHFGSKEGLLSAVVEDFYDRVEDAVLMARLDEYDDWWQRERERTRRYISFLREDPLADVVTRQLAGTPAVCRVEARRWQRLIAEGARNFAEGQARGVVSAALDCALLATMVLGGLRATVTDSTASSTYADTDAMVDAIWTFIGQGLGLEDRT